MNQVESTALAEIRDTFALFDDWEDKYRFLIDLGKDLPEMPARLRTDKHLVRGCQSQVWLIATVDEQDELGSVLNLAIDSDAHIVRGLAAIVIAALSGRTAQCILAVDMEGLFAELDLLQHLSATRGNGLRAMVGKIQQIATELVSQR